MYCEHEVANRLTWMKSQVLLRKLFTVNGHYLNNDWQEVNPHNSLFYVYFVIAQLFTISVFSLVHGILIHNFLFQLTVLVHSS